MEDYFNSTDEKKKNKSDASFSTCKLVLNSKSKDDSLVLTIFLFFFSLLFPAITLHKL